MIQSNAMKKHISQAKRLAVPERIQQFNAGRHAELWQMKYDKMSVNPFIFLRGTCHLFYEDWPGKMLNDAPRVWLCGDLHLENFGSYKGDNRQVYFDMNDFDEAVLGPAAWDVVRLLTSLLVGADSLRLKHADAKTLCEAYVKSYCQALAVGRARYVERETARGMVKDLLVSLSLRKRKNFLNDRTKVVGSQRRFRTDHPRQLAVSEMERAQITSYFKAWASHQPEPRFFRLLDITRRIAGTGSLGVERFILLVEGEGSPHTNYLLDLKEARPTALLSLAHKLKLKQPRWPNEAERVVTIEQRVQSTPPALLKSLTFGGKSYVLRELQPTADRVSLASTRGNVELLRPVIETMGELTAWGQLRSSGRQGSAIADELIEYAQHPRVAKDLLDCAHACHDQVVTDYQAYREAYESGYFNDEA
jgi:uncharacterized protein (DUF2252 family)